MQRIAFSAFALSINLAFAQVPVAATTGFIGDMVRSVGGDRVQVTVIAPANADPHSFEPKPSALLGVSKAKAIFANGLMLEPFLAKVQAQAPKNTPTLRLGEKQTGLIKGGEDPATTGFDPHLWLDPTYGIRYTELIRDTLIQIDPAGKSVYERNAKKYILEIQKADQAVLECLKPIPPQNRKIVAQHEALLYFARHYQITSIGAISDFAGQEKGPKSVVKLVRAMKQNGIKVLFTEPQFSRAEASAIAEAAGAKIGVIYSDAFDNQVNTYLKLLQANGKAVCDSFR